MTEVTDELLMNVLKYVQSDLVDVKDDQREISREHLKIRAAMNAIQSDATNLHSGQAKIEARLEHLQHAVDFRNGPAE